MCFKCSMCKSSARIPPIVHRVIQVSGYTDTLKVQASQLSDVTHKEIACHSRAAVLILLSRPPSSLGPGLLDRGGVAKHSSIVLVYWVL